MKSLEELLNISEQLEMQGDLKTSARIDEEVEKIIKEASKDLHKSGLKLDTVNNHKTLLENYTKAMKSLEKEYRRAMKSNNEIDSPNEGSLRMITGSYAHNCNAVRFHEMYFEDIIDSKPYPIKDNGQDLFKELYEGGYSTFEKEIFRLSKVPRNGWVLLNYCLLTKQLYLNAIDLHDHHVIAVSVPVMVLDMWEHAYYADFGLDKEKYVEWFLSRVDWRNPTKRIKALQRVK